jgi:hypothetical protein
MLALLTLAILEVSRPDDTLTDNSLLANLWWVTYLILDGCIAPLGTLKSTLAKWLIAVEGMQLDQ